MLADMHSHILPGIDDGSANLEESLAMLRAEQAQNVRTVLATPHFYAHRDHPDRFLRRRAEAAARLQEAIAGDETLPALRLGAEVYYYPGMSDSDDLPRLAIEGSRYILVELPMKKWSSSVYQELLQIRQRHGLVPIVAHVDRYISPLRTHGIPEALAELPVLVQANASFFLHRSTRSMALRMLKAGQIQLLGSDCHNMDDRAPNLQQAADAICRALGPQALQGVYQTQAQVLL